MYNKSKCRIHAQKDSRDDTGVFVRIFLVIYNICICIHTWSGRWQMICYDRSTDDQLPCEQILKTVFLTLTGCKAFVDSCKAFADSSHCSKLRIAKRASVKQLFRNHFGLRIISFTNTQIWKKWRENKIGVV